MDIETYPDCGGTLHGIAYTKGPPLIGCILGHDGPLVRYLRFRQRAPAGAGLRLLFEDISECPENRLWKFEPTP